MNRGVIKIDGPEASAFLQGLVTNDVENLQKNQIQYTCLLTPQGKYLFDFFVIKTPTGLLLECEGGERLRALMGLLKLYVLRRPIVVQDVSHEWTVVVADASAAPFPSATYFYIDPRSPGMGHRGLVPGRVEGASVKEAYDAQRLTLVIPEGSDDLQPQKSIILECGFDYLQAMSWTKGCYMGQELMARTKHRGLVRKRLFVLDVGEGLIPGIGSIVFAGDTEAGQVTSTYGAKGFALLRLEVLQPHMLAAGPTVRFESGQEARVYAPLDLGV